MPGMFHREEGASLWSDLHSGEAGLLPRVGLSACMLTVSIAMVLLISAVIDEAGNLRDHHVALALTFGGAGWFASLIFLWRSYRRRGRMLRGMIYIIGTWLVTIPLCFFVAEVVRVEEIFIGGIVFLAVAATILIATDTMYRMRRGSPIELPDGAINVHCPECGYSMIGLSDCQCPECGMSFTIDQLIKAQDYGATRRPAIEGDASPGNSPPAPPAPPAIPTPAALPPGTDGFSDAATRTT